MSLARHRRFHFTGYPPHHLVKAAMAHNGSGFEKRGGLALDLILSERIGSD